MNHSVIMTNAIRAVISQTSLFLNTVTAYVQ